MYHNLKIRDTLAKDKMQTKRSLKCCSNQLSVVPNVVLMDNCVSVVIFPCRYMASLMFKQIGAVMGEGRVIWDLWKTNE